MERNTCAIVIFTILIVACIVVSFFVVKNKVRIMYENHNKDTNITSNSDKNIENINNIEEVNMNEIIIKVNGRILNVKLEENTSAKAFVEKLKNGDIKINAHDYGNFEKVGNLGFTLPTSDENITTEPGDLILYQGNQITLYYDTNRWNFTRIGKVQNVSQKELKEILGNDNVELTFSLNI